MKTQIYAWAIAAGAFLFAGCSSDDVIQDGKDEDGVIQRIDVTLQEREAVADYNNFAWRLYQQVMAEDINDNKVISPLSVSLAVGMLANGAAEEIQDEIMDVLGVEGSGVEQLNSINAKLASGLERVDSKIKLSLANSFWYNASKIHPKRAFAKVLADSYDAEAIGFGDNPIGSINSWIEENTNGLIKNMLSADAVSDVYLINATYFKGMWTEEGKFDPKYTKKDQFRDYAGTISNGDFMQNSSEYYFCESKEAQHIALTMGSDGRGGYETFRFNIILPKESSTIGKSLEEMISGQVPMLYLRPVTLHMPKFDANFSENIVEDLRRAGLEKTFGSACDGIADEPVYFNLVQHGASISVDEEGATAAAATVIAGSTAPGVIDLSPIEIIIDRPFVYYITEQSTGAILFIGHIAHL